MYHSDTLDTIHFKSSFSFNAVISCLGLVPNLKVLKLSCIYRNNSLNSHIWTFPLLKRYEQCHRCNNETIAEIGQYCPLINTLIVPFSDEVNDECLIWILNLRNLVNLNIKGTNISRGGYVAILTELKGIINIIWTKDHINTILADIDIETLRNKELVSCNLQSAEMLVEKRTNIETLVLFDTESVNMSVLPQLE